MATLTTYESIEDVVATNQFDTVTGSDDVNSIYE